MSAIVNHKQGRPSSTENTNDVDETTCTRRSLAVMFNKQYCVICQKQYDKVHKVEYLETGHKMLAVAKQLNDKSIYMRLNSIPNASDAVANDVVYHLKCWVTA